MTSGISVRVEAGVGRLRRTPGGRTADAAAELREVVETYAGQVSAWQVDIAAGDRAASRWWRDQGFARTGPRGPLQAPGVVLHARHLLGRVVVGRGVAIRLTEVEAYTGPDDPASHAFTRTPRSELMYGDPWRLYVYRSYGIHLCANVVTGPPGHASAVLLRAGEVVGGLDVARGRRRGDGSDVRLGRGPGNLAVALGLQLEDNGADLVSADPDVEVRLTPTRSAPAAGRVVGGPRVGVSRAADVAWRFWLDGDPTVSAYRRSPRAPLMR